MFEREMSDSNDACIAFLGIRAENWRPGPLVHLTNLFEELHIAASKSRQNMAEEILKSCSKTFLRINLSSCHRRNTFQVNVDGFLKAARRCHGTIKIRKRGTSMGWDVGMLCLFKTVGKHHAALMTSCCTKIWWEFLASNLYHKKVTASL